MVALTAYQPTWAGTSTFVQKSVLPGDNLISILQKQGFSSEERERVLAQDKNLRRLFLTLDTHYLVRRQGDEVELHMFDSQTENAFKIIKNRNSVKVSAYNPEYKTTVTRVEGRVSGSLMNSVYTRVPSNWVATRFLDAYAFDLGTTQNLQKGARFSLTLEKRYEGPYFVKYGEVLQTSLETSHGFVTKRFVRYKNAGIFIRDHAPMDLKGFYAPVDYIRVSSRFQPHRLHPVTGRVQPHLGVDFELPEGASVLASRNGIVTKMGHSKAAGNFIVLMHANGIATGYAHMHVLDSRIHLGLPVRAGEKIGEVGCTGYCTRAHLHFAVKIHGQMVDPMKYIKPYSPHYETLLQDRLARN